MDTIKLTQRGNRRVWHDNLRKKVLKQVLKRHEKDVQSNFVRNSRKICTIEELYAGHMVNDGHWLYGGCGKVGCMMCQNWDLSHRDKVQNDKFDRELEDYENQAYFNN